MSFIDQIYKTIGENDCNQDVSDWLSTGYLPLNQSLSGSYSGGFPVGRLTEIYGSESSGKTLLATMALIETQKKNGLAIFLDYEHAFSLKRAKTLGLSDDKKKFIYKQPDSAEEGFSMLDKIVKIVRKDQPDKFVTVIVDSVASMITMEELAASYENGNMKTRLSLAAVMSSSLKQLSKMVSKSNITLIFLNQTRSNPGVIYGEKEKTSGGNALKFFASVRVKLTKKQKIKSGDTIIGENVEATVVKNKVYIPYEKATYISSFKVGIDLVASHVDALHEKKMLGSAAGWMEFEGKKYRRAQLIEKFNKDSELYKKALIMFK